MVSFHLVIESDDTAATTPGDVVLMLRKVQHDVTECKVKGEVKDINDKVVGEWSLDIED